MIKILGAVLIVTSACAVGFRMAGSVRYEERCLRQLSAALEMMRCEVSGQQTPAVELCEKAAAQTSGALKNVFSACAEQIRSRTHPDTRGIMDQALDLQEERLPHTCVTLLRELGGILGAYGDHEQVQALEAVSERGAKAMLELSQGKADRCRTYEVLGVCAGCALAIILL